MMSTKNFNDETIWIIGASSGIGRALAIELAKRGARLILSSRDQASLVTLNKELGKEHWVFTVDVADTENLLRTTKAISTFTDSLDRVIFLAGIYQPMLLNELDMLKVRQMIDVNFWGALNVLHAVMPLFEEQGFGQIAICASIAGFIGLPGGQPYSATKAALINLTESLAAECGNKIDVKLINPGFVRTRLTAKNKFSMPNLLEPEEAACAIVKGLHSRRFEIHFPKRFTILMKFLRCLPYRLALRLTKRMAKKNTK